jgi:hypothetical protein
MSDITTEILTEIAMRHRTTVAGYQFADKFDWQAIAADLRQLAAPSVSREPATKLKIDWPDDCGSAHHLEISIPEGVSIPVSRETRATQCKKHPLGKLPEGKGLWEVCHVGCEYPQGDCSCYCGINCEPEAAPLSGEGGERNPLEDKLAELQGQLNEAKKDAESWKHHWQMYRDAWVRELGGWTIPKSHEIDSLVLTTRKRCVNPLRGNCGTPHWLGKPTEDGKALQQTAHPLENSCRNWKADDSEPNKPAVAAQGQKNAPGETTVTIQPSTKHVLDEAAKDGVDLHEIVRNYKYCIDQLDRWNVPKSDEDDRLSLYGRMCILAPFAKAQALRVGGSPVRSVEGRKDNNANLHLPLESDGTQGPDVQGFGAGNYEQLRGGVRGWVSGDHQPQCIEEAINFLRWCASDNRNTNTEKAAQIADTLAALPGSLPTQPEECLHRVPLNGHCEACFTNSLGTNQRERGSLPSPAPSQINKFQKGETTMNFGQAIEALKQGQKVSRSGWNGKDMWLGLVTADQWGLGSSAPYDYGLVGNRLLPWIGMKTADGAFVPWLASQTDVLAEDWGVIA